MVLSAEQILGMVRDTREIGDEAGDLGSLCGALSNYLKALVQCDAVCFALMDGPRWRLVDPFSDTLGAVLEGRETGAWRRFHAGPIDGWALRTLDTLRGAVLLSGCSDADETRVRVEGFLEAATPVFLAAYLEAQVEARDAELAAVYAIDALRDQHLGFEDMLYRVLQEAQSRMPALRVAIGLADAHGGPLQVRWFPPEPTGEQIELARLMTRRAARNNAPISRADCLAVPLAVEGSAQKGALIAFCERLDDRARRVLEAVGSQLDTAIFEDLSKQRIEQVFRRYVSDAVVEEMLREGGDHYLQGQRRRVTALFSDLRGFTPLSEQLSVDVLVKMLNEHLAAMTEVVFRHGGTIDKFIGDCVMAFFGAPMDQPDHAHRAARAALEMQAAHEALRQKWAQTELPAPKLGIGLNSGEVMVGNIGSAQMSNYTIIGDHVNLAARLESLAGGGEVLIARGTQKLIENEFKLAVRGATAVKGKSEPIQVWALQAEI